MTSRNARKPWMAELAGPSGPTPARKPAVRSAGKGAIANTKKSVAGSVSRQAASASVVPARAAAPSANLGMNSERLRAGMVERLRDGGVRDSAVLAAMAAVPRHRFVDEALASRAYENTALPIGHGQTISQPYIVARMTEMLCHGGRPAKVLEIGTGCGYQAAVLAHVANEVYTIERVRALHDRARINLRPLRLANLRLVYGDGFKGLPEAAPFDGMLIAAAAEDLPRSLLEQLRVGGRALAPLGDRDQTLCLIVRTGEASWSRTALEPVRFVPLLPGLK